MSLAHSAYIKKTLKSRWIKRSKTESGCTLLRTLRHVHGGNAEKWCFSVISLLNLLLFQESLVFQDSDYVLYAGQSGVVLHRTSTFFAVLDDYTCCRWWSLNEKSPVEVGPPPLACSGEKAYCARQWFLLSSSNAFAQWKCGEDYALGQKPTNEVVSGRRGALDGIDTWSDCGLGR